VKQREIVAVIPTVKAKALNFVFVIAVAHSAESTRLWRDPGPIETLDLAAGPGGRNHAPVPPFQFVEEETHGRWPKVMVLDASRRKWVVKFGEEVKAETFASRISWALGYPVRASYYVSNGRIQRVTTLKRTAKFIRPNGEFGDARFQMFDRDGFRQVPDGKLDLAERRADQRELNGLKLTLLLVANWDLKSDNTGVFDIAGERYKVVTDWGATMGDPAAADRTRRKWNCEAFASRTKSLLDGVDSGYVHFNYTQYLGRHEQALANNITVADLEWFLGRAEKLTDDQVRGALLASGAAAAEATCFTRAFRERLKLFAAATRSPRSSMSPSARHENSGLR
jgi:hypothetical protein